MINDHTNLYALCHLATVCMCRQVLDAKYGLKRWQIGEIASKIGQLYYHY